MNAILARAEHILFACMAEALVKDSRWAYRRRHRSGARRTAPVVSPKRRSLTGERLEHPTDRTSATG